MIEKLEPIKAFNCSDTPQAKMQHHSYHNDCINKINELVDAVNELQKHEEQHLDLLTELNEMRLHKNKAPAKNVQDKFAEQRKWIGCLCRFWFDNKKQADIGILGDIDEDEIHPYFNADLGHNYKCCEPVKPDDDIIYKGDNNE